MELGGTPPLTESHCAQKSLAERGGTPSPPLMEKSRSVVFEGLPNIPSYLHVGSHVVSTLVGGDEHYLNPLNFLYFRI